MLIDNDLFLPHTHIRVPADDAFKKVWNDGPKSKSFADLSAALSVLGQTWGHLIKEGQGKTKVSQKDSPIDFVTQVDVGIELLFRDWIGRFFPEHKIVGEEGARDHIEPGDHVWYVDPIDGTTNFVEGKDNVTVHLGLIGNGKPLVGFVGVPILGRFYFGHVGSVVTPSVETQNFASLRTHRHTPQIGTEYMDNRLDEKKIYEKILKKLNAREFRKKSIGMNLLALLHGEIDAFYKPEAKYWDVIAPLTLIDFHGHNFWDIEVVLSDRSIFSPFSDDPKFIAHLNKVHQGNCRVGLITVTPKDRPDIKKAIIDVYFNDR